MNATVFSGKIVEWYLEHHRTLPWRQTKEPYKIWLSEIILQQTRVAQGLPYYRAFIRKYPTVRALAAADEQDILRLWQGLGYYTRARNLHACARAVMASPGKKFPTTFAGLRKLKGIGDYTAAAIASFAFDQPVAVVDGNVYRVLARIFGITDDIASTAGRKKFAELANRIVPKDKPAIYNQAIMEFGALQCTPRHPACTRCPFQGPCVARRQEMQDQLPVKRKPAKPVRRNFYYFAVRRGQQWLMKPRLGNDIWKNLWDFPLYEGTSRVSRAELARFLPADLRRHAGMRVTPVFKQTLSHQVICARFIEITLPVRKSLPRSPLFSQSRLLTVRKISEIPKPVLISRFLARHGIR